MAYTDYPNVAAPSNWDEARSGVFTVSTPELTIDLDSPPLSGALPTWDGTKYATVTDPGSPPEIPPTYAYHKYLFVSNTLFDLDDLYIDYTPFSSDNIAVTLYDSGGEVFVNPGNPAQSAFLVTDPNYWGTSPNATVIGVDDTGDTRRVSRIMWVTGLGESATYAPIVLTGVKAIALCGPDDNPQGRPTHLYGIYGVGESAEVQFWTGIDSMSDRLWPFKKRMTEIF